MNKIEIILPYVVIITCILIIIISVVIIVRDFIIFIKNCFKPENINKGDIFQFHRKERPLWKIEITQVKRRYFRYKVFYDYLPNQDYSLPPNPFQGRFITDFRKSYRKVNSNLKPLYTYEK